MHHAPRWKRWSAALLLPLLAACQDAAVTAPIQPPEAPDSRIAGLLKCEVTVATGSTACRMETPSSDGGPSYQIISDASEMYWMLRTQNVVYQAADSLLSIDIALENQLNKAIGTRDGTTATGFKLFLAENPYVTDFKAVPDSTTPVVLNGFSLRDAANTVRILNPDGRQAFIDANQPYFNYAGILPAGQTSAYRTWRFHVPNTVQQFFITLILFAPTPGEKLVPVLPPDTVPASIYDTAKIVRGDEYDSSWFLRDVFLVAFEPGASSEERTAAVELVNGTVVGGARIGDDGFYFVRIPDDGESINLNAALERMNGLPQVSWTLREYVDLADATGASLRPNDSGGDWGVNAWKLVSPDSVTDSPRWGLEAIQAPYAWGCTVGDSAVKIAVVDEAFIEHEDLENYQLGNNSTLYDPWHGGVVSSVLAARGDNGEGIAGTIWKSELHLYSVHDPAVNEILPGSGTIAATWKAIDDGNQVINLSRQIAYYQEVGDQPGPRRPDPNRPSDATRADGTAAVLAAILFKEVMIDGEDPLLVISAGNSTLPARWAGYAGVRQFWPSRVLVVGAADRKAPGTGDLGGSFTRGRWGDTLGLGGSASGSNYGELVDVYAPGVDVGSMNFKDNPSRGTGTSLSAPYVSGVAGLLLSLDSRLSAGELKTLIMTGAQRGNRRVLNENQGTSTRYLLNAYESLRAAAERPGAGLCGNEVYKDTTYTVFASRRVNGTYSWESIFNDGNAADLSVQHGTRSVVRGNGDHLFWRDRSILPGASWQVEPIPAPADNATWFSRRGLSHDGDTTVSVTKETVNDSVERFHVLLNGTEIVNFIGPKVKVPSVPAPRRCVMWALNGTEWADCFAEAVQRPDFRNSQFSYAYSSSRREIVVAVSRDSLSQTVELTSSMVYNGYWQRNYSIDYYTLGTHLYFISLASPYTIRTHVAVGRKIDNVGFSDDGKGLAMRATTFNRFESVTPEQTYLTRTLNCQSRFARTTRSGSTYSLTYYVSSPLLINYSNCNPDITYAP